MVYIKIMLLLNLLNLKDALQNVHGNVLGRLVEKGNITQVVSEKNYSFLLILVLMKVER